MPQEEPATEEIDQFIARWEKSGGHERGAGQQFLLELCDLLRLPRPDPPLGQNERNTYTFERLVTRVRPDGTVSPNWIDLYKAGHFVLETKQGVNPARDKLDPDAPLVLPGAPAVHAASAGHGRRGTAAFDRALERAYHQAVRYIQALPAADGRPPFLIVCDVGHTLDLYAEFSGTGGQYERFPDPVSHRIRLSDLHREEIRARLRGIWTDSRALDPSKHAAAVTREVAKALADLAKSLERDGHDPQVTAGFLQRCLFTMFAEDVGLLPGNSFLALLERVSDSPHGFPVMLRTLWTEMARGADFSTVLLEKIPHFNGGLFEDATALPLRSDQIAFLIHAAKSDWAAVEPAIFGTLLERALDPRERHKLGAHFTPRSYVERLVRATLIAPLRAQWEAVMTAAAQLDDLGKTAEARAAVESFHHHLCSLRILDPACGTGNFLYVALELLKRLEAEVLDLFGRLGGDPRLEMDSFKVRPDQFLGLEINARAVAVAQLVLWIGYFQWQRKTSGKADTGDRPLLPKNPTIRRQDAVLAYDAMIPRTDPETGAPVTIWDGRTTKPHPVTGREVPDETARTTVFDYTNPRRAEWPEADYIIGNPPFIGASRMREALGDGYTEALRKAWKGQVPESADFVMFWWQKAASAVASGSCKRFGFITTNSIHQTFNRRVLEPFLADAKKPLHLAYAIPDHPWVDSADGAAVRIAMTVAAPGRADGVLDKVVAETSLDNGENEVTLQSSAGSLAANLQVGADLTSCAPLLANSNLANHGVIRGGEGFLVAPDQLQMLGSGQRPGIERHLRPILNGSDLTSESRSNYVIDLYGLSESAVREYFPELYQWVFTRVRPGRLNNKRATRRDNWWLFNESVPKLRNMLEGLPRFIATSETAKHRVFTFVDGAVLPEHKLVNIATDDAFTIGVLSSIVHVKWSLSAGSWLGVGNDSVYVKSRGFEPFPFPALEESPLKQKIRDLGERLDAHRKRQQALHPDLTLTGMYNVLEKLRTGEALTDKEKKIHEQGLVSLLRQIHDDLDAAVLAAYGWDDLAVGGPLADRLAGGGEAAEALEQELLVRLVALNHERAAEEKRGLVRWLRPEYQAPGAAAGPAAEQPEMALPAGKAAPVAAAAALPWPAALPAQVAALQKLLPAFGPDPGALAAAFGRRNKSRRDQITGILETLRSLGKL